MGRKGAKLTDGAIEAAESLVAELDPLGEVSSRRMFGGLGIYCGSGHGKMPYVSVPAGNPELLPLAERALRIARAAKR